ncbi:hypothetical protein MM213_15440 [Belliella sp. R4-6]|uniref:Lipocalin-like domain-containing protein n=1 Tax=Belliella alkalica TaxID=1730871 RepID=A0ABS9VGC1_9BACT|nr:hypothetical protein [Belliella alkalica]MCH7414893.1 hypothetical protein [Belliella alkalica]
MKNKKIQSVRAWGVGLLFLVLMMIASCQEDGLPEGELKCPVEAVEGQEDDVVGKWKLVERRTISLFSGEIEVKDYSCDNVLYCFKPDGVLQINDNVGGWGYETGVYNYELIPPAENEDHIKLRIGDLKWPFKIGESEMTLNMAHVDGPISLFLRIE